MKRDGGIMNGKSIFYGFITGCLVSGAVTILTTPKSGSEMKQLLHINLRQVKNTLSNVQSKATQLKNQLQDVATDTVTTSSAVHTFSQNVKHSIENWKDDVNPTFDDLHKSILELHNTIDRLETEIKAK